MSSRLGSNKIGKTLKIILVLVDEQGEKAPDVSLTYTYALPPT